MFNESFSVFVNPEDKERINPDKEIFNQVFESEVSLRLLERLKDKFYENDYDDEEINEIVSHLLSNNNSEAFRGCLVFSDTQLNRIIEIYRNLRPAEFAQKMLDISRNQGYAIGYHLSTAEISPDVKGEWVIKGTEFDDRDEMLMAYYSLDYANMYRKKSGNNLYIVKAVVGDNSYHKKDTSNNWGRALSLEVVDRLDLREIDKIVEVKVNDIKEKVKKAA